MQVFSFFTRMVVPQPLNYTDKKILVASFPTDSENCKQEPRIFVLDPPRPCPGVMHTNSILRIFTVLVPSVFKIFFRYACVFVNRLYFPLVHFVPRWPWQDNRRVALNFLFFKKKWRWELWEMTAFCLIFIGFYLHFQ